MRLVSKIFSSVSPKSLTLGFLIVMACIAFIFTGFGSLNPGSLFGLDPNTAVQVGSEKIDMQQFSEAISSAKGSKDISQEELRIIAQKVMQEMIKNKIMVEQSLKIGWKTDNPEIASYIKAIPLFHDPVTNQFDIKIFKDFLSKRNLAELNFYNMLKERLDMQKFINLTYLPVVLPQELLKAQYLMQNTQFNYQYALVSIPEEVLKTKIATQAQNYAEDKNNELNLKNLYENTKNQFNKKPQTKVMSILISYKTAQRAQGEALNRTQDEAKNIINTMLSQIKGGTDFAALAGKTNDDPAAKNNKGNIGFVDETNIDPASLYAVSTLSAEKPLSEIVETPFGFRIFKFVEGIPGVTKKFEDVKIQLAEKILGEQIKQKLDAELQQEISSAIVSKNISKLSSILSENKISWIYATKLYKISDPYINELGIANKLAPLIFSLKKPGDIIPQVVDFGTKKAIIKLVSKTMPTTNSTQFETVKKDTTNTLNEEFVSALEQKLAKSYENNGKIKINPAIIK